MLQSLNKLITEFVEPNYLQAVNNTGTSIGFIGSSILFVSGNKSSFVKLIDFAHPIILSEETPKKLKKKYLSAIENMTFGILSLRAHLRNYYK